MTEPTIDFRQKYILIGREQGRAQAAEDVLDELEALAAEPDVELALQQRIIALKGKPPGPSASAGSSAHSTGAASAGARANTESLLDTFASDLDREPGTSVTARGAAQAAAPARASRDLLALFESDLPQQGA